VVRDGQLPARSGVGERGGGGGHRGRRAGGRPGGGWGGGEWGKRADAARPNHTRARRARPSATMEASSDLDGAPPEGAPGAAPAPTPQWAPPPTDDASSSSTEPLHGDEAEVFVGGLPPDVDDTALARALAAAGRVVALRVNRRKRTGECKGFAFATFADGAAAARACATVKEVRGGREGGGRVSLARGAPWGRLPSAACAPTRPRAGNGGRARACAPAHGRAARRAWRAQSPPAPPRARGVRPVNSSRAPAGRAPGAAGGGPARARRSRWEGRPQPSNPRPTTLRYTHTRRPHPRPPPVWWACAGRAPLPRPLARPRAGARRRGRRPRRRGRRPCRRVADTRPGRAAADGGRGGGRRVHRAPRAAAARARRPACGGRRRAQGRLLAAWRAGAVPPGRGRPRSRGRARPRHLSRGVPADGAPRRVRLPRPRRAQQDAARHPARVRHAAGAR